MAGILAACSSQKGVTASVTVQFDAMSQRRTVFEAVSRDRAGRHRGVGFRCDGRVLALNSYENRVYQIGIEDAEPLVAKFYRPARWSDAAIREEHAFAGELAAQEIPVVAPLTARRANRCMCIRAFATPFSHAAAGAGRNWATAMSANGSGRFLGRIHAVGRAAPLSTSAAL